ncbi:MAG: penicillin acylase family protein [Nostocaceae cyanobacterium]|nr:penicillin acylase family protein [Nostocaceae cyanobacterium]
MGKIFRSKILKILSITILTITLLTAAFSMWTVRRSFAQESGTIQIPALQAPVEVVRDKWGVPHIYAQNQHDLFMAQGYIHAQERFWQMDFWRHIGSGRLAEMFGSSQLDADKFLRTVGWARVAKQEFAQLDPTTKEILQDYARGVNAYLSNHQDTALSLEYGVLKMLNPNYKPEPWQPLHSLTWGKVMAYDLGWNMDSEITRSILLKTLTKQQVEELYPPYPSDHPIIVAENQDVGTTGEKRQGGDKKELSSVSHPPSVYPCSQSESCIAQLEEISASLHKLQPLLNSFTSAIGSNNWVISGKLTATGKPILANDPHLRVQNPSIWYEIGLHCSVKSLNCPYDVTGFSFAGMAGLIIGHNDRIAWGVTNVAPDTMDLYIEKINPNNPNQYEVNGKWVDMQLLQENIQISGGKSVTQTVRYTRHGPIISDAYSPVKDFKRKAGIDFPNSYAIALRWTALESSNLAASINQINRSQNWQEFRNAVQNFDIAAQNFVYADVDGNIGYQMPGKTPIRNSGDGRYPVPGWTDEFEWKGYIPFDKLPSVFNPESGYITTANNAVVDGNYPYLITTEWDAGYRAKRIDEMISAQKSPITVADVQKIQADNKNLNAETIVPILLQLPLQDKRLDQVKNLLQGWDFQQSADSTPAAIFNAFWKHLLADTFHNKLPKDAYPQGDDRWFEVVEKLVNKPNSPWWDNQKTSTVENRDKIFRQAFAEAVVELENTFGKDSRKWHWGDLHTITFTNLTLGKSGIAPIEKLFNRGPFPTAGGGSIVNATNWNAAESYMANWLPSMRMIIDVAEWDNSVSIQTPGQSGHAFHRHYDDLIKLWNNFEYHPMLSQRENVVKNGSGKLNLVPGKKG